MNWKKSVIAYDFNKMLARLTQQKAVLDSHRPIQDFRIARIREALALEWTYNSNSIEGNTLTLLETQVVIEDGLTVSGKSLREHFEAVNHHEAIAFVRELAQPGYTLHKRDILYIHAIVLDKIDKRIAGRIRDGNVRITGASFTPPDALQVEEQLQELIDWYHNEGAQLHAVVRASIFHHRLVWIHPFFDGNGRTARLVFNLLLMSEGYPPAIILTVDRKKYYTALRNGDQGDYEKLFFLIGQSLERSLAIYISNIEGTSNEFKPIPDIIKEPDIPYGQEYVSLLARQGKIEAYKEGRVWYTRKKAITNYQATRERKRL
jgi:Fic family protein